MKLTSLLLTLIPLSMIFFQGCTYGHFLDLRQYSTPIYFGSTIGQGITYKDLETWHSRLYFNADSGNAGSYTTGGFSQTRLGTGIYTTTSPSIHKSYRNTFPTDFGWLKENPDNLLILQKVTVTAEYQGLHGLIFSHQELVSKRRGE